MSSVFLLCSCATIDGSRYQHLAVSTFYNGQQIDDVHCSLTNNKGRWTILSQGSTAVQKSRGDMTIICNKNNIPTGKAVIESSLPDGTWIDFLAGGVIGTAIDSASEAVFEYPEYIIVEMGKTSLPPTSKESDERP